MRRRVPKGGREDWGGGCEGGEWERKWLKFILSMYEIVETLLKESSAVKNKEIREAQDINLATWADSE